jgi:hypothetical protein
MSATAEIIVAELKGVLQVPIKAVTTHRGKRVCWVKEADGPKLREIECGHFTEEYVEIESGLTEGELVYVEPPLELPAEPHGQGVEPEIAPIPEGVDEDAFIPAETEVEEAEQQSEYLTADGQIDWQKLGPALRELQALDEAEREKKWNEILDSMPSDARRQLEQMAARWQQGDSEGGEGGGRGQWRRGPQ